MENWPRGLANTVGLLVVQLMGMRMLMLFKSIGTSGQEYKRGRMSDKACRLNWSGKSGVVLGVGNPAGKKETAWREDKALDYFCFP